MRYHSLFSIQCATIFATLSIVLTLTTACSKKKNKRNSGGGGATVGTTEEPTEEPEPAPTPDTGNPSVGEEVPQSKAKSPPLILGRKWS
ncbi:MAG: hypothetical protein R3B45_15785 [Bdellovibrionota bacterium]